MISKNKKAKKELHETLHDSKKKNHVFLYTNENSINQKVKVAAVNVVHNITLKSFLKQTFQYTIYFAKFKDINLTLIIILKFKKNNKSYNKFTIFIDNQTAIISIINSTKKSKFVTMKKITNLINQLKKRMQKSIFNKFQLT